MTLLDRLFRRTTPAAPPPLASVPCPHVSLVPKWDSVADMGQEDKAIGYTCDTCDQTFTPAEARALRQTEAARLRQLASQPVVAEAERIVTGDQRPTPPSA
jgi:hypothetical protein